MEYVLYIRSKADTIERKSSYPIFWCYEWLVLTRMKNHSSGGLNPGCSGQGKSGPAWA